MIAASVAHQSIKRC